MPSDDLDQSEDAKDNEDENSKVSVFEANLTFHNVFHTDKIVLAEKLDEYNTGISIEQQGKVLIRDLASGKCISYMNLNTTITAAFLKDKRLYIGTSIGSFRIFDITENFMLKDVFGIKLSRKQEIKQLFATKTTLFIVFDCRVVLYNLSVDDSYCFSGFFNTSKSIVDLTIIETNEFFKCICLFEPGVLLEYRLDRKKLIQNPNVIQIHDNAYDLFGSKVDTNLTHITHDKNNEFIYCIGVDLYLRKYNLPKELLGNLEQRVNFPSTPLDDIQLIDDQPTKLFTQNSLLVVSTVNGDVVKYDPVSNDKIVIHVGSAKVNGISYTSKIYDDGSYVIGTYDGCVVFKDIEILEVENQNIDVPKETCTFKNENDIEYYEDIITREKFLQQEQRRKKIEQDLIVELTKLKQEYKELLASNDIAEPQKKITFDEFCIDIQEKENIEKSGQEETAKIYRNAERYTCRKELIHAKLKEQTFDKMDEHLKTITALEENLLVYNFPQPKLTNVENKTQTKIRLLRRLELRENRWRKDNGLQAGLDIEEVVIKHANFVVNGVPERPQLILTDYQARDAELREYIEEQRKKKEAMLNMQNGLNTKKKKFEIKNKERKRKRGTFLSTNKNNASLGTTQNQKVNTVVSDLQEVDVESWSIMYPSVELLSRFKKVNQIIFIKNIIRLIKKEFNSQFYEMMKIRNKKRDTLAENYKKIEEIHRELAIVDTLKEPTANIIER